MRLEQAAVQLERDQLDFREQKHELESICVVQRCWRGRVARRRTTMLFRSRAENEAAISEARERERAARLLQGQWRKRQAMKKVGFMRLGRNAEMERVIF
jgi:hypothetical protein